MDIIGILSEYIASLISGNDNEKSINVILSFLIYMSILSIIVFARPIALRFRILRRIFQKKEVYAGCYVQIVDGGEERRYSIIDIFYDHKAGGYFLKGIQYDTFGNRAIDFTSQNVAFRAGPSNCIEFVWQSESIEDKQRFDGYTMMCIDDPSNHDMYEGRGFFVTFHKFPLRYDLRFFKITAERLNHFRLTSKSINLELPSTEQARRKFVMALHVALITFPELQPIEAGGKPIL